MRKDQTSQPEHVNMPPVFPTELAMHYTMHIFVMAKLLEWKPQRVLDLGCGQGMVLASLNRNRKQVDYVGVDQANMEKHIEPRGGEFWMRDISRHWDFADAPFDAIVFSEVLEHLPYAVGMRTLKRIYNTLSHDGRCVLTTPLWVSKENAEYQRNKHFHINLWECNDLIRKLERIGFRVTEEWSARMVGSKIRLPTLQRYFDREYGESREANNVLDDVVARFGPLVAQSIFQHVVPRSKASHIQLVLTR